MIIVTYSYCGSFSVLGIIIFYTHSELFKLQVFAWYSAFCLTPSIHGKMQCVDTPFPLLKGHTKTILLKIKPSLIQPSCDGSLKKGEQWLSFIPLTEIQAQLTSRLYRGKEVEVWLWGCYSSLVFHSTVGSVEYGMLLLPWTESDCCYLLSWS